MVRVTGRAAGDNPADAHDVIRVVGARENNLRSVEVVIPKRRLTVFTGVSGSGKSSLVFATIAVESRRLVNETSTRLSCRASWRLAHVPTSTVWKD